MKFLFTLFSFLLSAAFNLFASPLKTSVEWNVPVHAFDVQTAENIVAYFSVTPITALEVIDVFLYHLQADMPKTYRSKQVTTYIPDAKPHYYLSAYSATYHKTVKKLLVNSSIFYHQSAKDFSRFYSVKV